MVSFDLVRPCTGSDPVGMVTDIYAVVVSICSGMLILRSKWINSAFVEVGAAAFLSLLTYRLGCTCH